MLNRLDQSGRIDSSPSFSMSTEHGVSRNQIVAELTKSPHGNLAEYVPMGRQACLQESEFLAHLIAWNYGHGQIRDSKVALPVITLTTPGFPGELRENSLAHLGLLDPRNLVLALRFSKEIRVLGWSGKNAIHRMIDRYLAAREDSRGFWDKTAVQHRGSLKELYALVHRKPSENANIILFGRDTQKQNRPYPSGSVFESIAHLKDMSATEAAGTILNRKIPFLIAQGALGNKIKDPDIVLALISQMSATELVTNTKLLQKLGVKTDPALRGAFEAALAKAGTSKKNTLKTTRAAEAVKDEALAGKLRELQERQLNSLGGVVGNWLVLADKSGSMAQAIDTARQVAAMLTRMVKGDVYLVFFDTQPLYINATGKSLEQITKETRFITAGGGTSIGCGLAYAMQRKLEVDGIAIVSDGAENQPPAFVDYYARWSRAQDRLVPVYLYLCRGERNNFTTTMNGAGFDVQTFDLRDQNVDYYSLPGLVQTMRTNRYGLVDEIMETPLLSLDEVFDDAKKGEEVLVHA